MTDQISLQSTTRTNALPANFFLKIIASFTLALLALVILVSLDSYLSGVSQQFFTPREGFRLDFSNTLEVFKEFWMWLAILLLTTSAGTALISKSITLSKIFLILILLAVIGLTILTFIGNFQDCEGLGCLGPYFMGLIAQGSWIIAAGSLPILSQTAFGKAQIFNKSFFIKAILILFSIPLLWFLATFGLRADLSKRASEAKSEVENIYSDVSIPIYEPTYLPPLVGKLGNERVQDYRGKGVYDTNPGRYWQSDYGGALEYTREYLYRDVLQFIITEYKLEKQIGDEQFYQNDLNQLNQEVQKSLNHPVPEFRKPNLENIESLRINNYPALYYLSYESPVLNVYRDGIRIQIHVLSDAKEIPKEEFIKVAESFKKVK